MRFCIATISSVNSCHSFLVHELYEEFFAQFLDLKAFLYKAIKNRSLNYKRHLKIKRKFVTSNIYIPDTVEMPDENMHRKDIEKGIAQAIQNLPEKRRIIFCMHRFEKLTYKEIAKIQGISIKTVETQIHRSLLFLEKQLSRFLNSIII